MDIVARMKAKAFGQACNQPAQYVLFHRHSADLYKPNDGILQYCETSAGDSVVAAYDSEEDEWYGPIVGSPLAIAWWLEEVNK